MTKLILTNIRSVQQSITVDRGSLGITSVLVQPGATATVEGVNAAVALQSLEPLIASQDILVGFDDDSVYSPKILPPVEVATTANLASLSGVPTIDNVALAVGDRVLVKNQTDAKLNGVYIVSVSGWRRDPNLSVTEQLTPFVSVFVKRGAANAGKAYVLSAATNPVLGVDNIAWVGWPSAGGAGTGDMVSTNNLSDVASPATSRINLGVEIGVDVQAHSAVLDATTASFTAADETKLDGIEALADVTDATNVEAAGALMDSEVDANLKTLTLPASTTISTFGASLVDDADAATSRGTLGLGSIATQDSSSVSITGGSVTGITSLAVADGGTGASTIQGAIANLRPAVATVPGATDTLAAGDDGVTILYTAAGLTTVTLADIAVGFEAVLVCLGAGGLTVAAGGQSFANGFTPQLTVAQGEALYVKQTAASTWVVLGGTAA